MQGLDLTRFFVGRSILIGQEDLLSNRNAPSNKKRGSVETLGYVTYDHGTSGDRFRTKKLGVSLHYINFDFEMKTDTSCLRASV